MSVSSRPPAPIILGAGLRAKLEVVFARYPDLESVTLFGSRALGSASSRSDIDLATEGIRDPATLGRLILDLEDLAIPQTCDVQALEEIRYPPLKRHIATAGVTIYSAPRVTRRASESGWVGDNCSGRS